MADENTGKIYIIVTDKLPSGETPTPEGVKNPAEKDKDDGSLFAHWAKNQILGLVKQTATQAVNFTLSNVGNFTGSYVAQSQINNARKIISNLMSIGSAAVAGSKFGAPGAIIGAVIATAGIVVSDTQEFISLQIQIRNNNREAAILRERSGLNEYIDGSRGTLY